MCAQPTEGGRDTRVHDTQRFSGILTLSSACAATLALERSGFAKQHEQIDAAWYARSRRFASLPMGQVAYVEHGRGPAALFLHGYPLNGYQWRGALERLHPYRRCIAPDVLGLGHTEAREGEAITPEAQVAMLAALLDTLDASRVDVVANDSGGLVAQLFVARYPDRVRSLLLTNCDVDENNPPQLFMPVARLAQKGLFVDRVLAPELKDLELARSEKGLGSVVYASRSAHGGDDRGVPRAAGGHTRKEAAGRCLCSGAGNSMCWCRCARRSSGGRARRAWCGGRRTRFFRCSGRDGWTSICRARAGCVPVEGAKLFFPEEMPELIAEEAKRLWNV